jgi:predicted  nucleic acid-binding Zn-ribbon protein
MKKLYENIEKINLKGDISQLTKVVSTIDISLQNIAVSTEQLVSELIKYSATNKGTQFEKVVNTTSALRDKLYQASLELNEMQQQVVAYQNKIYRYEGKNTTAQKPNKYIVAKNRNVNVDTTSVQFDRNEMMHVVSLLRNYRDEVTHRIKNIKNSKNDIGSVWRDRQYNDFSSFIDKVVTNIMEAVKIQDNYCVYLEEKIKELS